jgi:hypothetical protein
MNIEKKIRSLSLLRDEILQIIENGDAIIQIAYQKNPWFEPVFIKNALRGIAHILEESKLAKWLSGYSIPSTSNKTIGLIMAGNIPVVGFHDLLCVYLSGQKALIKLSHNDNILIPHILARLEIIEPEVKDRIKIDASISHVDAILATGSDNTSRYFRHTFKDIPHIIRKNRTSCAILNGSETASHFEALSEDIFMYFGLGCRNVSKVYLPDNVKVEELIPNLGKFDWLSEHQKYMNNYRFLVSKYALEGAEFIDGQYFILAQNPNLVSPISCIYYETYVDPEKLKILMDSNKNKIQCIVSRNGWYENSMTFGKAQYPEPWEYADDMDTMDFLLGL